MLIVAPIPKGTERKKKKKYLKCHVLGVTCHLDQLEELKMPKVLKVKREMSRHFGRRRGTGLFKGSLWVQRSFGSNIMAFL